MMIAKNRVRVFLLLFVHLDEKAVIIESLVKVPNTTEMLDKIKQQQLYIVETKKVISKLHSITVVSNTDLSKVCIVKKKQVIEA